jgi:hypothetical protein
MGPLLVGEDSKVGREHCDGIARAGLNEYIGNFQLELLRRCKR